MNEFNFAPRPTVKICGMEFDLDITDVGMISAVIDSYAALTEQYARLKEKQNELVSEADTQSALREVEEANRALYEVAKGFITRVLGIDGYEKIFSRRKASSAEHVELCNFIYANLLLNRNQYIEAKMQEEEDGED